MSELISTRGWKRRAGGLPRPARKRADYLERSLRESSHKPLNRVVAQSTASEECFAKYWKNLQLPSEAFARPVFCRTGTWVAFGGSTSGSFSIVLKIAPGVASDSHTGGRSHGTTSQSALGRVPVEGVREALGAGRSGRHLGRRGPASGGGQG